MSIAKAGKAAATEVNGLLKLVLLIVWEIPTTLVRFVFLTFPITALKVIWEVLKGFLEMIFNLLADAIDLALSLCVLAAIGVLVWHLFL